MSGFAEFLNQSKTIQEAKKPVASKSGFWRTVSKSRFFSWVFLAFGVIFVMASHTFGATLEHPSMRATVQQAGHPTAVFLGMIFGVSLLIGLLKIRPIKRWPKADERAAGTTVPFSLPNQPPVNPNPPPGGSGPTGGSSPPAIHEQAPLTISAAADDVLKAQGPRIDNKDYGRNTEKAVSATSPRTYIPVLMRAVLPVPAGADSLNGEQGKNREVLSSEGVASSNTVLGGNNEKRYSVSSAQNEEVKGSQVVGSNNEVGSNAVNIQGLTEGVTSEERVVRHPEQSEGSKGVSRFFSRRLQNDKVIEVSKIRSRVLEVLGTLKVGLGASLKVLLGKGIRRIENRSESSLRIKGGVRGVEGVTKAAKVGISALIKQGGDVNAQTIYRSNRYSQGSRVVSAEYRDNSEGSRTPESNGTSKAQKVFALINTAIATVVSFVKNRARNDGGEAVSTNIRTQARTSTTFRNKYTQSLITYIHLHGYGKHFLVGRVAPVLALLFATPVTSLASSTPTLISKVAALSVTTQIWIAVLAITAVVILYLLWNAKKNGKPIAPIINKTGTISGLLISTYVIKFIPHLIKFGLVAKLAALPLFVPVVSWILGLVGIAFLTKFFYGKLKFSIMRKKVEAQYVRQYRTKKQFDNNPRKIRRIASLLMHKDLKDPETEKLVHGPERLRQFVSKWKLRIVGIVGDFIDTTVDVSTFFTKLTKINSRADIGNTPKLLLGIAILATIVYLPLKFLYHWIAHHSVAINKQFNKIEKGEFVINDIHVQEAIHEVKNDNWRTSLYMFMTEFKYIFPNIYNAIRFGTGRSLFFALSAKLVPAIIHHLVSSTPIGVIWVLTYLGHSILLNLFLQTRSQIMSIVHNVLIDASKETLSRRFVDIKGNPTQNLKLIIEAYKINKTKTEPDEWFNNKRIIDAYKNGYLYVDKNKTLLKILREMHGPRSIKSILKLYVLLDLLAIPIYLVNILIPFVLHIRALKVIGNMPNNKRLLQRATTLQSLNTNFYSGVIGLLIVQWEITFAVKIGQIAGGPVQPLVDTIEGPKGLINMFSMIDAHFHGYAPGDRSFDPLRATYKDLGFNLQKYDFIKAFETSINHPQALSLRTQEAIKDWKFENGDKSNKPLTYSQFREALEKNSLLYGIEHLPGGAKAAKLGGRQMTEEELVKEMDKLGVSIDMLKAQAGSRLAQDGDKDALTVVDVLEGDTAFIIRIADNQYLKVPLKGDNKPIEIGPGIELPKELENLKDDHQVVWVLSNDDRVSTPKDFGVILDTLSGKLVQVRSTHGKNTEGRSY